jgi:hypothetical protein
MITEQTLMIEGAAIVHLSKKICCTMMHCTGWMFMERSTSSQYDVVVAHMSRREGVLLMRKRAQTPRPVVLTPLHQGVRGVRVASVRARRGFHRHERQLVPPRRQSRET